MIVSGVPFEIRDARLEGGFQRRQRARRVRVVSLAIPRPSSKKLAGTPPLARLRNDALM